MASNPKLKRDVLNIETILQILNCLAKEENGASIALFYNVEKSTISDIKNDNNESSKGPSSADAFSALETAMELYEQHRVLSHSTTAAQENQILATKKRRCTLVQ
ncbi:hypothetical protein TNCV_3312501 [Trichonephila clavipes]|nr:hypothetical protein TNCV_3312501 [Trichonephila clavipes]